MLQRYYYFCNAQIYNLRIRKFNRVFFQLQQQIELLKQETGALKNDLETASRDKAAVEAKLKTVSDEVRV